MIRARLGLVILLALTCLPTQIAFAQMGGIRATTESYDAGLAGLPHLDPKIAEGYITIDGRAELRVRPTEIRVVLAVTSEAATAQKCQQSIDATIERLKAAWTKLGIAPEHIVIDFIAVLPTYVWSMEKDGLVEVATEKKSGYRMQTNVHLAAQSESLAQTALTKAFEQGITDIIAFDYWSKELDEIKEKARDRAVKAARRKADAMLGVLFHDAPPLINVQEQTNVRFPDSLYQTIVQRDDETVRYGGGRDMQYIHAYRPRHTYYRGLYSDGDVQPRELPMKPEISVTSTVRLYFKSPSSAEASKQDFAPKSSALK